MSLTISFSSISSPASFERAAVRVGRLPCHGRWVDFLRRGLCDALCRLCGSRRVLGHGGQRPCQYMRWLKLRRAFGKNVGNHSRVCVRCLFRAALGVRRLCLCALWLLLRSRAGVPFRPMGFSACLFFYRWLVFWLFPWEAPRAMLWRVRCSLRARARSRFLCTTF